MSAALPDDLLVRDLLVRAVEAVTSPPPGVDRRPAPLARAQLVQWAAWVVGGSSGAVGPALRWALDVGLHQPEPTTSADLPEAPASEGAAADLPARLRQLLAHLNSAHAAQEQAS